MGTIEIFKATDVDVPEIGAIMKTVKNTMTDPSWFCADNEEFIARHISTEGFILKAVVDGQLAGFLMVRLPGDSRDNLGHHLGLSRSGLMKVAHMESTAVLPEFRGRHILKSLVKCAEGALELTNCSYYMATVHPENKYSLKNFESLGYKVILTTEKYGGLPRHILCKRNE